MKMIISGNKCYQILHEVKRHENCTTDYVILYNNEVVYWRPSLKEIGMEYTRVNDIISIMNRIKSKTRNIEKKQALLNHWSELYNIIRDIKIDLLTSPIVEYDPYMFA